MARQHEGGLLVSVEDDGPGLTPAELARAFELYFTTKERGTGLGLAIADRIAREHGGRLEAISAEGEGAAFTLWLPAAGDSCPAPLTAPGSP